MSVVDLCYTFSMLPEKIIFVGVFLSLIGQILYIRSIIYGTTRPNLVSWFIWMLAPFIAVFFQLKAGAGLSVVPVFMTGFGPLLVIIVSIFNKNAYWKISQFDMICGALAVIALVLYVFTHNLEISIIFAILSDGLAAVPTLVKSWQFPETEVGYGYFAAFISNILGLLVIKDWSFTIYSFGVYNVIINASILFCIYHQKILKNKIIA